jgi:lysophospholipase L1-like esterase
LILNEWRDGRAQTVTSSRTVSVLDQATVTWNDLVDVAPGVAPGDYLVPSWVASTLAARDTAVTSADTATTKAAEAAASAASIVGQRGVANGYASLDGSALLPEAQVPVRLTATVQNATIATAISTQAVPRWTPTTAYAINAAAVSPNGDVVTAIAAHTSGASFTQANWHLSPTVTRPPVAFYAGTRVKTWQPARGVYNGESPVLRQFRTKVATALRAGTGLRIAAFGDSKTFGSGLGTGIQTFADSYPAQLADLLGGFPGLITANGGDYQWSAITGFVVADSNRNDLTTPAGGGSVTLWPLRAFTSLRLYGYISAGGTVSITVDGGAPITWTIAGGSPWRTYDLTGLSNARHVIVISTTVTGFALRGASYIYTGTPIIVDNHGRQGAIASTWLPSAWIGIYEGVTSGNIGPVADVAIMNLGTNSDTTANLQTVAANVKALNIPLILLAPGGLGNDSTYNPRRAQVFDVADALDLPLIDLTHIIGAYDTANAAGLMGDTIHENGRGYALEASAIARVMLSA